MKKARISVSVYKGPNMRPTVSAEFHVTKELGETIILDHPKIKFSRVGEEVVSLVIKSLEYVSKDEIDLTVWARVPLGTALQKVLINLAREGIVHTRVVYK
jgi:hypothetical protein